jgi:flagellar assembly protein FliH
MTSAPAPFTFDLDLGGRSERTKFMRQSTLEAELAKARRDGYEHGFAEGERSTASETAKATAAAAVKLAEESVAMNVAFVQALQTRSAEAAQLALAAARKLAASLLDRQPLAEIEALLAECLASVQDAPHMVVRCHPDLADALRDAAEQHLESTGFGGRLVILGEPEIPLGDCRIEWADGGLVRDFAGTNQDMDEAIARFLTTRDGTAAEETTQ